MRIAKVIALLGTLAQGGILIYGFSQGDFNAAGSFFFHDPWGIVSLVDVYVGFIFFSVWIVYREKEWWSAGLWVAAIMILGNFPAGLYAFLTLQRSGSNWQKFWMGRHYLEEGK
jgi:hypothetical protein